MEEAGIGLTTLATLSVWQSPLTTSCSVFKRNITRAQFHQWAISTGIESKTMQANADLFDIAS